MGIENIGGINSAAKGIEYDKNEIQDAMKKETTTYEEARSANGNYVIIHDNENNRSYTLADYDKDGKIDSLRLEIHNNDTGDSTILDDINFDGNFDRKIDVKNTGKGSLMAFDNEIDGKVDEYLYFRNDE